MQNKLRAESVGTQFLPWAAVVRVEELIFFAFLSRSLAPGSSLLFYVQGIIRTTTPPHLRATPSGVRTVRDHRQLRTRKNAGRARS